MNTMRVSYDEMKAAIKRAFIKHGLSEEKAEICAKIHTETTYDGVYSHGTNRVARFCGYLDRGWVKKDGEPELKKEFGAIRIYDGNLGPGITNSLFCCERAMELADRYGIGMVGIRNTTHWMRGGSYGKYLAERGYIGILWTNTESVMPPWGGKDPRIGNNPIIFAMPGEDGKPLFMDMAISQYSYGKLQVTRLAGKKLPYPGGYDEEGNLTDVPGDIEKSRRILPMGYWKGSAFAFMLDVLGAALTEGKSAKNMDEEDRESCTGCSQVFIVINPDTYSDAEAIREKVKEASGYLKTSEPAEPGSDIHVPGEGLERFHKDHDENGIYVDDSIWNKILSL
nr:3-dehydro-L-gulonate 2-dehydrogenase [Clostridium sp. Marseille-P2415]